MAIRGVIVVLKAADLNLCVGRWKGGGPVSENGIIPRTPLGSGLSQTGGAPQLHVPPIPEQHNITRVHLMGIDPYSLYAYWELTQEFREMVARHFRCDWDVLPLVLRLYAANDRGENMLIKHETNITHFTDNWYFHGLNPGHRYVMDLGTRNVYSVFVALLRSNYVATPRNWPGKTVGRMPAELENWLPEAISTSYHRLF